MTEEKHGPQKKLFSVFLDKVNSDSEIKNTPLVLPEGIYGSGFITVIGKLVIITFASFYAATGGDARKLVSNVPINALPSYAINSIYPDSDEAGRGVVFIQNGKTELNFYEYSPRIGKYGTLIYLTK